MTLTKPTIKTTPLWQLPPIPEDFTLIQDTREQLPLFTPERQSRDKTFLYRDKLLITTGTLHNGDYSVIGYENKVCIELKRLSDFLDYVGKDRKATEAKLERMGNYFFKALVINESEDRVLHPEVYSYDMRSRLKNAHIRGFLKAIRVKYGLHVYIHEDIEKCREFSIKALTTAIEQIRGETEGMRINRFIEECKVKHGIHVYINDNDDLCREFVVDHLTYAVRKLRVQETNQGDQ